MVSAARIRTDLERNHTMVVGAGLYVLRYVSAKTAHRCPFVKVRVSWKSVHALSLISAPGGSPDTLSAPGDCIVVRAQHSGALDLTISASDPNTSLDAELRLERIVTAGQSDSPRPTPTDATSALEVIAHVSRRGDISASQGQWIGGPHLPLPIEGIEIRWPNRPADVGLKYSMVLSGSNQKRILTGAAGDFVGTRGRSIPIVGAELALTGPGASRCQLRGDALFSGAAVVSEHGSLLRFTGPSGREPLVGLRLAAVPAEELPAVAQRLTAAASSAQNELGKVRVYRPTSTPSSRITGSMGA